MSSLVARILLALLMLPLASVVYLLTVVSLVQRSGYPQGEAAFMCANVVTALFVAGFWIVLWRRSVRWTPARVGLSVAAAFGSLIAGVVVGAVTGQLEKEFGVFIGGVIWILLWLALTVLVWRETSDERAARIRGAGGETLACPRCGYNMTGLRESVCPECGASYTLTELVASQPRNQQTEVEGG